MKGVLLFCFFISLGTVEAAAAPASHEIAGEVTSEGVILQSRLSDPQGQYWNVHFELSRARDFANSIKTGPKAALPEHDFVVKEKISNLIPATRYYYRSVWSSIQKSPSIQSQTHTFKTLPGALLDQDINFSVVACMNYDYFKRGRFWQEVLSPYYDPNKRLGYPALNAISGLKPDFLVAMGDNVYYDPNLAWPARTRTQMRIKWREQLSQTRFVQLFSETPIYWLMDDHDFRFDNANPGISRGPSPELGAAVFSEQLPIFGPDDGPIFYRTHRVSRALQMWILDNRTLRSANHLPDGPGKSIWGKEQLEWLKRSLLESDAPFKIIFSSTPLIGPDRFPTQDNHTNGFRFERRTFFKWLKENNFDRKNLYFVVGDSHWKYHSEDPLGFEEFSTGSLDSSNALRGIKPGDPNSTDPAGEIKQPYIDSTPLGGFLRVSVGSGVLEFSFYDSRGTKLYSASRRAI